MSKPAQKLRGRLVFIAALAFIHASAMPVAAGDLTYLVHAPTRPSPHPPLIVLLHGSGADERDMIGLWKDLPANLVVISPRAPFDHVGGGYVWYRKAGAVPKPGDLELSRKIVDLVVENAIQRFDADPKRIYLAGFSQGAVMTYEVALREPDRFRGAAVLSGLLFPSATAGLPPAADRSRETFFVAHGTADPVIPFAAATAARARLAGLGVPVDFHAYAGMRHTIGPQETSDFAAWLSQHGAGDGVAAP
jgi:phospholipase/carboxylesterase